MDGSKSSRKRRVSFRGTRVFQVEAVPCDLKPEVWYTGKELEKLVAAEMESMKDCDLRQCCSIAGGRRTNNNNNLKQVMPSLSLMGSKYYPKSSHNNHKHKTHTCESHTPRGLEKYHTNTKSHHHVHRVVTVFQTQRQQYKGGWEPQSLRRVSQNMSKEDTKAALKRAKRDYVEVYGGGGGGAKKDASSSSTAAVAASSSSSSSNNTKVGTNRLMALLNRAA